MIDADIAPKSLAVQAQRGLRVAGMRLDLELSIWDAMIIAAALQAICDTLWTEDLQHGMMIENRLRIASPFHSASQGSDPKQLAVTPLDRTQWLGHWPSAPLHHVNQFLKIPFSSNIYSLASPG